LQIPKELWETTEEEKKDIVLQKQKQMAYADLQQQSGVLTLLETPNHTLIILGPHVCVDRAVLLAGLFFKHQIQLKELHRKKTQDALRLEDERARLSNSYVEEFTVDPSLVGLVIGKKGVNIREAEGMPGIESIRIHSESGQITILAKDKESAQGARRLLEFVQDTFPVPRRLLGRVIGPKYQHIREIEASSKVQRIRVPEDSSRPNPAQNGPPGRRNRRDDSADNGPDVHIMIVGTRDTVATAKLLLEQHLKFAVEAQNLSNEHQNVRGQLQELSKNYGIRRRDQEVDGDNKEQGGRRRQGLAGGSRQGRRAASSDSSTDGGAASLAGNGAASTAAPIGTANGNGSRAPLSEEEQAKRRARGQERRARRAANPAGNGAGAADATPAETPGKEEPKTKKAGPRQPAARAEVAVDQD